MATGTLSADGQSDTVRLQRGVAMLSNDFGGGTAVVQVYDAVFATWVALTNGSFTEAGVVGFEFPFPMDVRIDLSGATTPDFDWNLSGS